MRGLTKYGGELTKSSVELARESRKIGVYTEGVSDFPIY